MDHEEGSRRLDGGAAFLAASRRGGGDEARSVSLFEAVPFRRRSNRRAVPRRQFQSV
jgi:hypothetical protein